MSRDEIFETLDSLPDVGLLLDLGHLLVGELDRGRRDAFEPGLLGGDPERLDALGQ